MAHSTNGSSKSGADLKVDDGVAGFTRRQASPAEDLPTATQALCHAATTFEHAVIRLVELDPKHAEEVFSATELDTLRLFSAVVTNWRGFLGMEE